MVNTVGPVTAAAQLNSMLCGPVSRCGRVCSCEVHSDLAKNRSWAEGETKNTKARKTGTDQNAVLVLAAQADCLVSHNKSLE